MDANEDRPESVGRKVGEVASATGLTVRALHYYEEIGLLESSGRSAGGHRLYSSTDLARLYRIRSLQGLGLSLAEVGRALDDPAWHLGSLLTRHVADLDRRLVATTQLRGRLNHLLGSVETGRSPATEELLDVLEEMTMLDTNIQRRIGILVYADLERAHDHLVEVFGLGPGQLSRDEDGNVVHGEIEAGDGVLWLHPESETYGLASPHTLGAASACVAVIVDDVDAHHARAVEKGADIVYAPVDQPYGYREYSARDPEGQLWSFMKPLD
jgi:DNA-binding transcriptional MerR regulator